MKLTASTKSFFVFMVLMTAIILITALSSPMFYVAASGSLLLCDKLLNLKCMPLAVKLLEFPAEHGSSSAQEQLGWFYYLGMGVPQSNEAARKWFERAASKGSTKAQKSLGFLELAEGGDHADKFVKAQKWFEKAASRGAPDCEYRMSRLYFNGTGVKQDLAKSFAWCSKAANHGSLWAESELGNYYLYGIATKPDATAATSWYEKAAKQGLPEAQYWLALALFSGSGIKQDNQKAIGWLETASQHGFCRANLPLGEVYYFNLLGKKDDGQAKSRLTAAAAQGSSLAKFLLTGLAACTTDGAARLNKIVQAARAGDSHAQATIASLYAAGLGRKQDNQQALSLYKTAAQSDADAQFALGQYYFYGPDGLPHFSESANWRQKSATNGNSDAAVELAQMYRAGEGVSLNGKRCLTLLTKSAEAGNTAGQLDLALAHQRGDGAIRSEEQFLKWILKAAEQGDAAAEDYYADALGRSDERDAFQKGVKWRMAAADQGYGPSMSTLAYSYMLGVSVKQDSKKAVSMLQELANRGDTDSMVQLASNYRYGFLGAEKDKNKARDLYLKAANDGDVEAQMDLGDMYRLEELGKENAPEGCKWYEKAAAQGDEKAIEKVKKHCKGEKDSASN